MDPNKIDKDPDKIDDDPDPAFHVMPIRIRLLIKVTNTDLKNIHGFRMSLLGSIDSL